MKVRRNHRIVSVAVIVAVGNTDGRREVLGMDIGPSEVETFWVEFLRKLRRRGLRGVKLIVSGAYEGHQGRRRQADERDLAALRGPYHAQRARPRRQEQPARRLSLHGDRLRARQR